MTWQFDFTVTGMTRAEANALMAFILEEAKYYTATIGGGFAAVDENGDALEGDTHDAPDAQS